MSVNGVTGNTPVNADNNTNGANGAAIQEKIQLFDGTKKQSETQMVHEPTQEELEKAQKEAQREAKRNAYQNGTRSFEQIISDTYHFVGYLFDPDINETKVGLTKYLERRYSEPKLDKRGHDGNAVCRYGL